jgi:hypothetical protein
MNEPWAPMQGEAKKGIPRMTQIYAGGNAPLAGEVHRWSEIHLGHLICVICG